MILKPLFMLDIAWCSRFKKRKAYKKNKEKVNVCTIAPNKMVGFVHVRR